LRSCHTLLSSLRAGDHDKALAALYALDGAQNSLDRARDRACRVVQSLMDTFSPAENAALFSGPGRTEIGGNHTDHQHGRVLCGSVDMDMLACAAPNGKPRPGNRPGQPVRPGGGEKHLRRPGAGGGRQGAGVGLHPGGLRRLRDLNRPVGFRPLLLRRLRDPGGQHL